MNPVVNQVDTTTATIASSGSLSGAVDLGGRVLCSIQMPAAWTSAALTFQGSLDGSTYFDIYDSGGTELSFTVAASRLVSVVPYAWLGLRFIKVRSNTAASPTAQGAERVLTLGLRDFTA